MIRWFRDSNVRTDIPQAETSANSTDHQQSSASVLINKEDQVEDGEHCLHDPEKTSREKRSICSNNANALEDSGRIVIDGVNSRSILPEKQRASEEESPLNVSILGKDLEWLPESKASSSDLSLEIRVNGVKFLLDIYVIFIELANPAEVFDGFFSLSLGHEPPG
jgi:hypothetical protein